MLDEYRASGTLSPVPFDRSTEELLDAVRETDEFDDHTRRYLLDGDTAETLIEEISGRDDAADLYHEIGLLTDDEVLLRLLSALERDPDPDAVDGLLLLVWRTDPVVSPKAIRVLGRIGTPRVREELSRQIETEAHTDIRVAAIEALAGWENEEYRETLRDVAECDDDPTVRKAARTVLDG
jgi:HEAT repeat protein